MDAALATAVINEATSRNMLSGGLPETDEEKVALAHELVEKAKANRDRVRGIGRDACDAIINLAATVSNEVSTPEEQKETMPEPDTSHQDEPKRRPLKEAFEMHVEMAGTRKVESLPVPPEIEGEVPDLPIDLTKESDLSLRQLYSANNALSQRAKWLVAQEDGRHNAALAVLKNREASVLDSLPKQIDGKNVLSAVLEAQVAEDVEVQEWRANVKKHADNLRSLKALRDIYDSNCERISREWSMRTETWAKEGQLPSRR